MWEDTPTPLPIDTCQRLAKAYNRNWYIFLLKDEVGKPAIPHDFRKTRGAASRLSYESLLAFDNAGLLLDKIESLNEAGGTSILDGMPANVSDNPEAVAAKFREKAGVSGQPHTPDIYAVLRFWRERLSNGGLYVSQVKFPTKELRAFCVSRKGHHLVVLSNQDPPTARAFSLLHEVGHLLLGTDAMCKPDGSTFGQSQEPWCNRFAAAVLLPRSEVEANPKYHDLISGEISVGSGRSLARDFGVSELALFRRLETFGDIANAKYQELQAASEEGWAERPNKTSTGWQEHPKRIMAKESPLFVRQVFDAHSNGDISYREVGSLLDIPVHSIPNVREAAL